MFTLACVVIANYDLCMTVQAERDLFEVPLTDQPIMRDVEIVVERPGGLYDCHVPIGLIRPMDVPVGHARIKSLDEDIGKFSVESGGTGQKSPGRVGYVPGDDFMEIIDGFHRYDILHARRAPTFYTTVGQMTLETLIDERIMNANMHDDLKFARIAEWMIQAWVLHPLSEKLTVADVFNLARYKSAKGSNFDITEEQVEETREWGNTKAEKWGTSVGSIQDILKTATHLAPDIVHNVRPARSQAAPGSMSISPAAAGVLATTLPDKRQHQRLVAKATVTQGLSRTQTAALADEISVMTASQASKHVRSKDWGEKKKPAFERVTYTHNELVRLGLRTSSAVQPLQELTMFTENQLRGLDLSDASDSSLEKLAADLQAVHDRIGGMISRVSIGLEDIDGFESDDDAMLRPIEEFLSDLGGALDNGDFPTILSDEELAAAEELLEDDDVALSIDPVRLKKLHKHLETYKNKN